MASYVLWLSTVSRLNKVPWHLCTPSYLLAEIVAPPSGCSTNPEFRAPPDGATRWMVQGARLCQSLVIKTFIRRALWRASFCRAAAARILQKQPPAYRLPFAALGLACCCRSVRATTLCHAGSEHSSTLVVVIFRVPSYHCLCRTLLPRYIHAGAFGSRALSEPVE